MTRRSGMILSLAVVAALAAGYAMTTVGRSSSPANGKAAQVAGASTEREASTEANDVESRAAQVADLTGLWRFDPAGSDMPRWGGRGSGDRPGGPGFGPRANGGERRGGGLEGGRRRGSGGPGGGGGPRGGFGGRMPSLIEIHEDTGAVTLADSTGEPFAEIRFDGTAPQPKSSESPESGGSSTESGPRVMAGHWHEGVLQVEREGRNGMKALQSFALADGGKTLVVRNQMAADGDRPAREFKRVYRRVTGS